MHPSAGSVLTGAIPHPNSLSAMPGVIQLPLTRVPCAAEKPCCCRTPSGRCLQTGTWWGLWVWTTVPQARFPLSWVPKMLGCSSSCRKHKVGNIVRIGMYDTSL
jgi:hypothetical protein